MKPGGGSSLHGPAGSPVVPVPEVPELPVALSLALTVLVGAPVVPVADSLTLPAVALSLSLALPVGTRPVLGVTVAEPTVPSVVVADADSPGRLSSPQAALHMARRDSTARERRETRAISAR